MAHIQLPPEQRGLLYAVRVLPLHPNLLMTQSSPSPLEDYPNGTWLGDENNPEMRVRCAIIPSDMLHISTNCRTAEKMALTLLDYLFHREVQAVSNLSGQGKHGKKQLDPLTIYGIRCKRAGHSAGSHGPHAGGSAGTLGSVFPL